MTSDPTTALGQQRFVSLTTFKRNGEGVATPMWIGRDGADLFVWTPADSWKVKRVRNNPRVLLAPSSRFGKVRDGVLPTEGAAQVVTDPVTVKRLGDVIRRKYGLGYRLVTLVETIATREAGRGSSCGSHSRTELLAGSTDEFRARHRSYL